MARSEKPSAGATWRGEGNKWAKLHFPRDPQPWNLSGLVSGTAVASRHGQVWPEPQTNRPAMSHLTELLPRRQFCCPYFIAPDLLYRRQSPVCTKESLIRHCWGGIPGTERVRYTSSKKETWFQFFQTKLKMLNSIQRQEFHYSWSFSWIACNRKILHTQKKKRKSFTYSPLQHSSTFQCDH